MWNIMEWTQRWAKWGGLLFTGPVTVAMAVGFYNLFSSQLKKVLAWSADKLNAVLADAVTNMDLQNAVVEYTGLAGYFATHLRFADCLNVVITVIWMKFLLTKIPFLRW